MFPMLNETIARPIKLFLDTPISVHATDSKQVNCILVGYTPGKKTPTYMASPLQFLLLELCLPG